MSREAIEVALRRYREELRLTEKVEQLSPRSTAGRSSSGPRGS